MNGAGSGSHLMGSILKITGVFSGTCIMNKYVDVDVMMCWIGVASVALP